MRTEAHPVRVRGDLVRGWSIEALTRGVAMGDEMAFEAFYRGWFDECYGMARSLTRRDEAFCLDVVQDAMLRAAKGIKPMSGEAQLAVWMRRVVHTAAIDRLRADRRRAKREREAADDGVVGAIDERIEWLRAAIEKLPAEDRSVLMIRFGKLRSLKAASDAEGVSEGSIKGRVRRVLARLRSAAEQTESKERS
ncbi:MAG: sigma-70 family RNA polymerase sigma factor [Planctomycetota bacterium]